MQEIQRPTVLAGEVKRLISLVHYIAPLMGLHASVLVQEALVSCACTAPGSDRAQAFQQDALGPSRPQSQQGSRADKQQDMKPEGQHQAAPPVPVVSSIAEWYMTTVVRDHRNIGVSISKARYGKRWQHHIYRAVVQHLHALVSAVSGALHAIGEACLCGSCQSTYAASVLLHALVSVTLACTAGLCSGCLADLQEVFCEP